MLRALLALLLVLLPGRASAFSCAGATAGLPAPFAAAECCLTLEKARRFDCLERAVGTGTEDTDIAALLAAFEAARTRSPLLEQQCHPVVHALGRLSFRRSGDLGTAFRGCTDSCIFGCQHGVLERFLAPFLQGQATGQDHVDVTRLEEVLPDVCDPDRLGTDSVKDLFQCRHGLGHAVLFTLGYDLQEGLRLCGALRGADARDACVSGVFMENIRAADPSMRDLRPDNPLYPCDSVEERYRARCANEQSRVFVELGWDRERMLEGCRALAPYQEKCYEGYGRDLSSPLRRGDEATTVLACLPLSGEDRLACVRGLVRGLIGAGTDARTAFVFCSKMPADTRAACFRESGAYVTWYLPSERVLERDCRALPPAAARVCLDSALPRHDPVGRWAWRLLGSAARMLGYETPPVS